MTQPLQVLAGLSLAGGLLNLPGTLFCCRWLERYVESALPTVAQTAEHGLSEGAGMLISSLVALAGIGAAWWVYHRDTRAMSAVALRYPRVYRSLTGLYHLDEGYKRILIEPGMRLSEWLARVFDQQGIDWLVNMVGEVVAATGDFVRHYQPGFVRSYALWFVIGAVAIVGGQALGGLTSSLNVLVAILLVLLVGFAAWVVRPRSEA